jgi:O-antigen/teichoic acid export membrane protein
VFNSRRRAMQLMYAPVLSVAIVLMMGRVLVFARLLSVEEFGRFNIGMLSSSTFCMLACIGLQMVLQREWPVYLVRGLERQGLVRAAQCNVIAVACAVLGACGAAVLTLRWSEARLISLGMIHGLSQQVFVIANFEGRSRGEPLRSANQNLLRASILLVGGVGAALASGSAVMVILVEAAISLTISAAIFRGALVRGRMATSLAFRLAVRQLPRAPWRSAIVLMVVSIVFFFVFNLDRWIAADRLGAAGFAHYSFAWIVLTAAQSAQAVINAAVYPMLARRMGRLGQAAARRFSALLSAAVFVAGALAIVPTWIIVGLLIDRWFPQYANTKTLILIFLGVAIFRVSDFWSSYLLIIGRERAVLVWNSTLTVLVTLLWAAGLWTRGSAGIAPTDIAVLAAALALCCYVGNVILVFRSPPQD